MNHDQAKSAAQARYDEALQKWEQARHEYRIATRGKQKLAKNVQACAGAVVRADNELRDLERAERSAMENYESRQVSP